MCVKAYLCVSKGFMTQGKLNHQKWEPDGNSGLYFSWKAEKLANELKPRLDSNEGTTANNYMWKWSPVLQCVHTMKARIYVYT